MSIELPFGHLICTYELRLTDVEDFGIPMTDVLEGNVPPPDSGLRVNIAFEGEAEGRLAGTIRGLVRSYPRSRWIMQLGAESAAPDPAFGTYTLDHTPWERIHPHS